VLETVLTRRAAERGRALGRLLVVVFSIAYPSDLLAQGLRELTPERLAADPPLAGALPTDLAWHPDGKRLTFLRHKDGGTDLCALDAGNGHESVLLAGSKVRIGDGGDDKPLPLTGYAWSPAGDSVLVPARGDVFLVEVRSGTVRPLVRTPDNEEYSQFSPDGRRVAFTRNGDLFAVDVASGREMRLTQSGSATVLNGRLDWVYEEELGSRTGKAYAWAPDSRTIAYLQLDQSRVPTFPIVDFLSVRNEATFQRYPTAGSPNAIPRVGVVGIGGDGTPGPERLLPIEPDDAYVVPDLAWQPDSRAVAFQHVNREQNTLELRLLPVPESPTAPLGPPRTVLTEKSDTWINVLLPPRFLRDGKRFLWLSERDGFAHLYSCDLAGACRVVTQGAWIVDARTTFTRLSGLVQVDERTGFVYFTATEKDPRERHFYRARLDGTGRIRLTQEDGTHRAFLSPDGRFYADTWSDVANPPRLVVSSVDGKRRYNVSEDKKAALLEYARGSVEWVSVLAHDGKALHAMLVKPPGFDPARRYPVVLSVYGGPHAQTVTNSWDAVSPLEQLLASRGFLVWSLDNRGSSGRGHAFETPIFKDMGRIELEDHLAGVEHLKSLPYVDPARIGIYGWSYGGYLTLYAATHAPDVFKAAVAGAPVTDYRFYDTIYTERYMRTPAANPQGYETSSPLSKAGDVRADLLILHGTSDDNVHFANTAAFVDALTKAGRPYALRVFPREMHAFREKANRTARDAAILEHFETYLK
jgi:dipeptidyl-peptidase-4